MKPNLSKKPWWNYIDNDLQNLFLESEILSNKVATWEEQFHDYSFVVFPAAKAYEGFLKNLFLDMGFISEKDFLGKRFRIGKALNPELATQEKFAKKSVYNKLSLFCKGDSIPSTLWDVWKQSRNLLFHWFPMEQNAIRFDEAKLRLQMITKAIDTVYTTCKLDLPNKDAE